MCSILDVVYDDIVLSTDDGTIDGEVLGYNEGDDPCPNDGITHNNALRDDDGSLFGSPFVILYDVYDGTVLGADNGIINGEVLEYTEGIEMIPMIIS